MQSDLLKVPSALIEAVKIGCTQTERQARPRAPIKAELETFGERAEYSDFSVFRVYAIVGHDQKTQRHGIRPDQRFAGPG